MYIQNLQMSEFRCFRQAGLSFRTPTGEDLDPAILPNVTLIVGGNGGGKTTILKGIALALLSPSLSESGFRPRYLVRRTKKTVSEARATIKADAAYHWQDFGEDKPSDLARPADVSLEIERIEDTERLTWSLLQGVTLREVAEVTAEPPESKAMPSVLGRSSAAELENRLQKQLFEPISPACFMVGYGATRRVETKERFDPADRDNSSLPHYQRVAGLFEDHVGLTPLAAWLPLVKHPGRAKQVATLLTELLPEKCSFPDVIENGDYIFDLDGTALPFDALSDGYRAYIGWIADMLYHVCRGCPDEVKLNEYRGVIMVDEIDLHLHPAWQREVVTQLSKALPLMQFILTSHSPIVAGSAEPSNVRLLRLTKEGDAVEIEESGAPLFGLNATQILESPYFGLETTRAPVAVSSLQRLARRAESGDSDSGLEFLKALAGDRAGLTSSLRSKPETDWNAAVTLQRDLVVKRARKPKSAKKTKQPKKRGKKGP